MYSNKTLQSKELSKNEYYIDKTEYTDRSKIKIKHEIYSNCKFLHIKKTRTVRSSFKYN